MKKKLYKTKECYNCGFIIFQYTDSCNGKPDENDPHMLLTTCPHCGNAFYNGETEKK